MQPLDDQDQADTCNALSLLDLVNNSSLAAPVTDRQLQPCYQLAVTTRQR